MIWKLLPERSRVGVQARATLHTVTAGGRALQAGTIAFDPDDLVGTLRLDLAVRISDIRSGDALLDGKAQDHVDSRRYAVARYRLERARGSETALALEGVVDWRDRQVPIRTIAQVDRSATEIRGRTRFELDLSRFGLVAPRLLFLKVADVVTVDVEIVAASSG